MNAHTAQLVTLMLAVGLLCAGFVLLLMTIASMAIETWRRVRSSVRPGAVAAAGLDLRVEAVRRRRARRLMLIAGALVAASFIVSLVARTL